MYQRVVIRLLIAGLLDPPSPIPLLGERDHARRYLRGSQNLAGAEGFEPSALGFGDRCSDQTELRPYAPTEFYPTPLRLPLASNRGGLSRQCRSERGPRRPLAAF